MINEQNFSDFKKEETYVNLPATGKIKMKLKSQNFLPYAGK
jgi:hypothetical protein